jgi:putative ABC transport system ATP-binding protein
VLSAHKISKVFWMRGAKKPLHVFGGVSLTLRAGEMLALVGPSGSGKSTLLRCLAGLEPVTEGQVVLLQTNLSRATRTAIAAMLREDVGLLMVNPPLVPSLTALQNVELPGLLAARSAWSNRELALRVLEELGARDIANKVPGQLTPPQAARVALARVLTQNPKIVFADEPTGRLGIEDSDTVLEQLGNLTRKGCAVVLATHDLHLAARADRVITIIDGAPRATLDHPSAYTILASLERSTKGATAPTPPPTPDAVLPSPAAPPPPAPAVRATPPTPAAAPSPPAPPGSVRDGSAADAAGGAGRGGEVEP